MVGFSSMEVYYRPIVEDYSNGLVWQSSKMGHDQLFARFAKLRQILVRGDFSRANWVQNRNPQALGFKMSYPGQTSGHKNKRYGPRPN